MDSATPPSPAGLFASTQRLLATLLGVVRTRIEIFATELEEEREHLKTLLIYSVVALILLVLGLIAVTVFVTLWLWQWFGAYTVGALGLVMIAAGMLLVARIKHNERVRPRLFATTLAELRKDAEELRRDHPAA